MNILRMLINLCCVTNDDQHQFYGPKPKDHIRTLFILKLRQDYYSLDDDLENRDKQQVATGMFNSATFVSNMLGNMGIESKVVIVVDNNNIDAEVTKFKPTHVFIEGYWVVPDKFTVLKKLHPTVDWIVRCHSEMPFLAQEGVAIDWTFKYWEAGIKVAGNSPRINEELRLMASVSASKPGKIARTKMCPFLPNYYPTSNMTTRVITPEQCTEYVDIACFGAVRPMKNHMVQAIAAIKYAVVHNKKLRFHINKGRIELYGANTLKNLKALFDNTPEHQLVEHAWTGHTEFLKIIRTMDICLQASFSETFNIVTADAVSVGCPIVVSPEVAWAHPAVFADPTSSIDIYDKMCRVMSNKRYYAYENAKQLKEFSKRSRDVWSNFFKL